MNFVYNTPILNNLNIPEVQFRSNQTGYIDTSGYQKDSFSSNPLYENFVDKNTITQIAKTNPQIQNILKQNNIPLNVNIAELEKLKQGHLMDTRVTAAKMYSSLPQELKSRVNLSDLQQAAMLHDYGKVLIPDKILNKNGRLTEEERKIMELHSELGSELLKVQGVDEKVLNLIKYHHQNPHGTGYPAINNGFDYDISSQILTTADKYSALREKRSYKEPLNREEALKVIQEDVDNGIISQEVYNALIRSV